MDTNLFAVIVTIGFSLLGVLGDYFLKLASENENSLRTPWFYIGFAVYASTAFSVWSAANYFRAFLQLLSQRGGAPAA